MAIAILGLKRTFYLSTQLLSVYLFDIFMISLWNGISKKRTIKSKKYRQKDLRVNLKVVLGLVFRDKLVYDGKNLALQAIARWAFFASAK